MSRAEKLAAKILSGRADKNFDFDDLCYILDRAGFESRSGRGSHQIYSGDGIGEIYQYSAPERKGQALPGKTGAHAASKV
jgi:hypothetical protein